MGPIGEIKLKFNRKKKPLRETSSHPARQGRVSRSVASEVGISAEQLQKIMTSTPSPKKRLGKKSSSPNEMTTQGEQKIEDEKENIGAIRPIKEQSKVISEAELGCQNISDF